MLKKFIVLWVILLAFSGLAFAQAEEESIVLESFTDEAFGFEAVKPVDWGNVGPGLYARQASPQDTTLLALQSAPARAELVWRSLLPQFALDEIPEPTGELETAALMWTLYQFEVSVVQVKIDLAIAEQGGTTYIVLLQTSPDEFDALHEAVFNPVLDSFAPLITEEEDLPYTVEAVTFENGDITLAGTLTLPDAEGPYPAVVLMTGSGPQTRDEIVVPGFPIFRIIADYLTREGFAVLRYDDRGMGESTGDYDTATIYDFAADAQAAVNYLHTRDDINPAQVGVLGHSEGGVYAAILGADPDSGVDFIISMAGIGVSGKDVVIKQSQLILQAGGASQERVNRTAEQLEMLLPLAMARDFDTFAETVRTLAAEDWELMTEDERAESGAETVEEYIEIALEGNLEAFQQESLISLLNYDPYEDWQQTTVPVLAIFGELDLQVDPLQNLPPMAEALLSGGNGDVTFVVIPGANHLFQKATTGHPDEYFELPPEFTGDFLPTISTWLHNHIAAMNES